MALRSPGRLITATALTVTNTGSGMGIFTHGEVMQYKQSSSWPFPYARPTTMDYLVVAGGGASAGWIYDSGGGGGGGVLTATGVSITAGTLTVNVGAGGSYTYNVISNGTSSKVVVGLFLMQDQLLWII